MEKARLNICLISIWGMVLLLIFLCIKKQPETMYQYRKDSEIEPDNITIYIQDGYVFHALIHEFGHIYLHFHPMEEEFKELFKTEAKSLITAYYGDSPYYYTDEKEYFAQAFQTVLCMGGHDTQKAAPDTFCYMSRLIGEMFDEK